MDTQIFFQTLKRHSKWFLLKKKSIVKKPKFYWERRLDRTSEGNGVAVRRKKISTFKIGRDVTNF